MLEFVIELGLTSSFDAGKHLERMFRYVLVSSKCRPDVAAQYFTNLDLANYAFRNPNLSEALLRAEYAKGKQY